MAGLFVFFLVLIVVGGVGYLAYLAQKKRREAFATMAQQLGLTYAIQDPFGLVSEPFALFSKGDGQGVENVMWGVWQGINLRAFDFWYFERTSDGKGGTSKTYYRFDCTIVPIEAACMRLTITHENVLTRLGSALSFHDIQFESEGFNKAYNVKSADKKFANDLIDSRMVQWLLADGAGYSFEIIGSEVLCYTKKIAPLAFVPLLGTAQGFLEHVPTVVHSLYPLNPG
jgi:hypothetical protein